MKARLSSDATGRFHERAVQDLDAFYDAMKQIALGVWVEDEENGRVYQRPPDRQALATLIDHAKGRPAVTQAAVGDTLITLVARVPRPGKETTNDGGARDSPSADIGDSAGGER